VDVETTTSFIPWMKDFYYQLDCDVSAFLTNYVNLLVFPFFFFTEQQYFNIFCAYNPFSKNHRACVKAHDNHPKFFDVSG